jgi:thioredoxin 1
MLNTNLKHVETEEQLRQLLMNHQNVVICCGRMESTRLPVYRTLEELEREYAHVAFRDRESDPAVMGLPFTVYFRDGQVVAVTTSIQSKDQIRKILDAEFGRPTSVAQGSKPDS